MVRERNSCGLWRSFWWNAEREASLNLNFSATAFWFPRKGREAGVFPGFSLGGWGFSLSVWFSLI
jgi:hypothetical protein